MSRCVLLIEHEARLLHQVRQGLRDAGFLVMPLHDADEAIDLLCLVSFDLVLADVATVRLSTVRAGNGLAALVRVARGAPLLLYTTHPAVEGADAHLVVVGHPARDLPGLLAAIERLLLVSPWSPGGAAALPPDSGDVDDLIYAPFLQTTDDSEQPVGRTIW